MHVNPEGKGMTLLNKLSRNTVLPPRISTQGVSVRYWSASGIIPPLICFVLGSIAVGVCFSRLWGSYASLSWPVVDGKVIQSTNGSRYYDEPSGEWLSTPGCVRYEYEVAGVYYVGDRISFSKSPVELPPEFRMGQQVAVHYAPGNASMSVLVPGTVDVEFLILFMCGVFMISIGAVMSAAALHTLLVMHHPQPKEVTVPAGLVIERESRRTIDDDNESMNYMTLEIPKGVGGIWQFVGIFIVMWPMAAVVWIAIEGRFSLLWPSLFAAGVPVVFECICAMSRRAMCICVGRDAVLISERCWGGRGGGRLIPIQTVEVLYAIDGYFAANYWSQEEQGSSSYVRCTQGGLPKGTYPWLAALLRLLKSRHGTVMSASQGTPVWSQFGFKNQAELIGAVSPTTAGRVR